MPHPHANRNMRGGRSYIAALLLNRSRFVMRTGTLRPQLHHALQSSSENRPALLLFGRKKTVMELVQSPQGSG